MDTSQHFQHIPKIVSPIQPLHVTLPDDSIIGISTNPVQPSTNHHSFDLGIDAVRPLNSRQGLNFGNNPVQPLPYHHSFDCGIDSIQPSTHAQLNFSPEPFAIKFGDNVLPSSEIESSTLTPVDVLLGKFSRLRCESKVGTLAVKLAREALFGDKVMHKCTVMGERGLPGLRAAELMELKKILFKQFPQLWASRHEFEALWKVSVDSLGQACKRLRHKNPPALI